MLFDVLQILKPKVVDKIPSIDQIQDKIFKKNKI